MPPILLLLGIGHIPALLPRSQEERVWLYKHSSPVGKLIRAALRPGSENDQALRIAASSEATCIIQTIKELVCK